MRIALGIEYDGSTFLGWQSQPQGNTVQDALQLALGEIAAMPVSVIAAGRTDTGVHAIEQVVHFDTTAERPMSAWVRGVNALLPPGIAVLWSQAVSDNFHARFSAHSRSYQYFLFCRPVRSALLHGRVGWFHQALDLQKMQQAAGYLLGEHDFSAFRAAECQAKSPVKTISRLELREEHGMIVVEISANAFLHHMVRNIVGCLVYVGKGKHAPEWMGEVLAGKSRARAAPTFAPDGLYLRRISYPPEWKLPQISEG